LNAPLDRVESVSELEEESEESPPVTTDQLAKGVKGSDVEKGEKPEWMKMLDQVQPTTVTKLNFMPKYKKNRFSKKNK
jgi:hypothetical protein